MKKKVYISVTNDLSHDQRVDKVCNSLSKEDYELTLIGRLKPDSQSIKRHYKTKRFKLFFNRGALFYANYNLRLFCYLLPKKIDVLHANDLDTLLANYLISLIKNIPLVYDSHEYFTGVPEIQDRKTVKTIWTAIEEWIFPKLRHVYTVNDSIADLYYEDYGIRPQVMRNIPTQQELPLKADLRSIGVTASKTLVLQGAGINIDRGAEELLEAMTHLEDYQLIIIGSGDVIEKLQERAKRDDLKNKVFFLGKLPYNEMMSFTQAASAGITLDKDTNINYKFSLPNKVFDYIRAGIPVISSNIIEIEKVIKKYKVGTITPSHDPLVIAETINTYLCNVNLPELNKNLKLASKQLSWENEVLNLVDTYKNLTKNH